MRVPDLVRAPGVRTTRMGRDETVWQSTLCGVSGGLLFPRSALRRTNTQTCQVIMGVAGHMLWVLPAPGAQTLPHDGRTTRRPSSAEPGRTTERDREENGLDDHRLEALSPRGTVREVSDGVVDAAMGRPFLSPGPKSTSERAQARALKIVPGIAPNWRTTP